METYESFYNTLCRVCLTQGKVQDMVSLIDNSNTIGLSCFGIALSKFVNITVKKDDYLPTVMCPNCLFLLKQTIRLKLVCESSDKRLKSVVKSINTNHNINRKIVMKTISEHVLYGTYFTKTYTEKPYNQQVIQLSTDHSRFLKVEVELKPLETKALNKERNNDDITNNDNPSCGFPKRNLNYNYQVNKDIKTKPCNKTKNKICKKRIVKIKNALLKRARKKEENCKQEFVCEICNKVLATKLSLRIHIQRHTGGRFMCEYCAKHYPTNEELQVHQVCTHGTGRYIQCSKCPFKAPRKKEFKEHERLHTGERPYACEKCGLTFRTRYIWRKHGRYHEEKSVQCVHCPLKFHLKSEMKAHVNNMHERLYMYLCNQCGATYSTTQTVRIHLTKKHGIARELQGRIKRILKGKDSEFPEQ